ncbi:protein translocase subunit SecD [Corynebacterium epidermidicanis]|uniref:Protein translocase subunit SecD n=1 Tax=Corynebacterium epidermidicanis TaxID=1050174 RepID=A0A0G3GQ41_9CORY|nr:protein translocase subunit SecD [Corynebacterium epidermidicanis]AKK03274.1 protein-export membrane protein, SecD/SecF family [Corynebacterium epidermidicanis]
MSASSGSISSRRSWPKQAIGLFILVLLTVYGLIFLTGDHSIKPKLGIDLQGGTRVTLVPQGAEPTKEQLAQARMILENRVNGMGVTGASVVTDGNTLVITVPGEDTSQARALGQTSQLLFRPVAQPGNPEPKAVLDTTLDMANRWIAKGVITPEQAKASLTTTVEALNSGTEEGAEKFTAGEITATPPAEPANSVEATQRRQEVTAMLRDDRQSDDPAKQYAAAGLLQCTDELDPIAGTDDPAKPLVTCDGQGGKYVLEPAPLLVGQTDPVTGKRLTGNEIDSNRQIAGGLNSQTGQMEINFSFKSEGGEQGASTWAKVTQEYLQRQIAITLDSQIISAPVIQSATPAGSATSITGDFTQQEAQDLANNLKYGALPLSFAGENGERGGTATTIPASLGSASLKAGLIAGLVGLIAVALYALAYYRVFGLLAMFTLVASGALVYGTLVLLGRWIGYSLDLAGVAGLIIGIGTTADSFVVFYERIKDEIRDGRTFRSSVPRAWDSAKRTVVTGNMVSLIAAVVLYILAVGEVKGFAFTLGLTTVYDLLITFLLTGPLVILASRNPWFARPGVNGLASVMKVADRRRADGELDHDEHKPAEQAKTSVNTHAENEEA